MGWAYQWQKSLETTHIVSGSVKYGARAAPKLASLDLLIAPTRIGTILISSLCPPSIGLKLMEGWRGAYPSKTFLT